MKIDILGVKIDKVTMEEAVRIVEAMCIDGHKYQLVTPNPEFIVKAQKDVEFRKIINQADLAVPDGIGVVWASKVLKANRVGLNQQTFAGRVAGIDLMNNLCKLAAQKGYTIFLLGGQGRVVNKTAEILKESFPNLRILGKYEGNPMDDKETREIIFSSAKGVIIDFLFVAYGAPLQDKWIARNLPFLPVKVAMGVGGAFDFIAGKQKRAPEFLQNLGIEWLWRLLHQPSRWKRQITLLKFVLLVVKKRFWMV